MSHDEAAAYLRNLVNKYLYRDAFATSTVYDPTIMDNILRLLEKQAGNEMSYSEVGGHIGVIKKLLF